MSNQIASNEASDVENRKPSHVGLSALLGEHGVELEFVERRRSPWDIAAAWYGLNDVTSCVQRSTDIPADVHSADFARWLTHEYRLAMAKGIQLGRDGTEDRPSASFSD